MSDFKQILNNIKRYIDLESEDEKQFTSILVEREIKKKEYIVKPGDNFIPISFVKKGVFRSFTIDKKGVEHTVRLAIDDWFITDVTSYMNQTPAKLFIQALEDSEIYQMEHSDVEELCSKNQKIQYFFRKITEKAFAFSQKRILSNLNKTAKERYLEFQKRYPEISKKIPQYVLASYLRMTPEFLSKIRKEISKS